MRRPGSVRACALLFGLAVAGMAVTACTVQDPPPSALKSQKFLLGPFNMSPAGTPDYRESGNIAMPHPEGDIAVKAIRWMVLDGDGNEMPASDHRLHFHHVVAYSNRAPDPACGGSSQRFAAPGSERTNLELPNGYGYFTKTSDRWYGNYDLMNMDDEELTDVRVQYEVIYTTERSSLKDVTPYWLDLAPCVSAGEIRVPGGGEPGSVYSASKSFKLDYPGIVVAVRGHLHDRGIDIALTAPNGDDICRTAAEYEEDGGDGGMDHGGGGDMEHGEEPGGHHSGPRLVAIPLCKDLGYPIAAGSTVRVTARYHNEDPLDDAMAKMLVYIAENRPPTTTRPPTSLPPTTAAPAPGDAGSGAQAAPGFGPVWSGDWHGGRGVPGAVGAVPGAPVTRSAGGW
jgi:hypothetical protein